MKSWNVFSGDWSRMRYRMNQTLWESGGGRGGSGLRGSMQAVNTFAPKKKKKKKFKNGILEGLENDGQQSGAEVWSSDSEDGFGDGAPQKDTTRSVPDPKKGRLEQQAAAMQAGKSAQQEVSGKEWQVKDPAALQEAIVWAEILDDPVSVKRRKRRVNQYYGDQGNAYRR